MNIKSSYLQNNNVKETKAKIKIKRCKIKINIDFILKYNSFDSFFI